MSKLPVITDARVEQYMLDLMDSTGQKGLPVNAAPVFNEMEALADRTHFPIVGPHVGRALGTHAGLIGARRIVDLGCGFGYSALWLAAGAGAGAEVICVDTNPDNLQRAKAFHQSARLAVDFEYQNVDAFDMLELDPRPFDVVGCDVEKELYPGICRLAVPRLRPGGLYMAASALWCGKVTVFGTTWDAWTTAVHQHNDWLFRQDNLFTQLYDQGDGLIASVRRS